MPGSSFSAVRAVSMVASNRGTSGASMITATWTSSEPKGASQCSGALGPTSPSSSARAAMPWRNSGAKVSSDSCSTPSAPNPAYVNPTLKEVSVAGWCTSWTTSARRSASVRPSRGSSMRRSRKAPAYGVGRPRKTPAWMSSSSSVMLLSPVMVPPEAVVDRAASRVPYSAEYLEGEFCEVRLQSVAYGPLPVLTRALPYPSAIRTSNNLLKSALAVSTNTPRVPPAPIATEYSPPEYAQPCIGSQFMPLSRVNELANVLNIIETVAQNWALICAISSDMSILASKLTRLPSRLNSPAATTPSISSSSCSVATSLAPFLSCFRDAPCSYHSLKQAAMNSR